MELSGFDDTDEEDGEGDPPDVVAELAAELLSHKILVGPGMARAFVVGIAAVHACDGAFDAVHELGASAIDFSVSSRVVVDLLGFVFSEDAEGAFFVHIGVADCHRNGKGGDVHHQDVQNEKARVERRDGDDVEATGADGEGLKEAVEDAEA